MNYYDYREYFRQIIADLDSISNQQTTTYSEIQTIHTDINNRLEKIDSTITTYAIMITAFILISTVISVFTK